MIVKLTYAALAFAVAAAVSASAVSFFPGSFRSEPAYRRACDMTVWCTVLGLLSAASVLSLAILGLSH